MKSLLKEKNQTKLVAFYFKIFRNGLLTEASAPTSKYELIPSIIKWNGFLQEFYLRNFSNFTEEHSKDSWGSFNPMIHFFSCRVHLGNADGTQPDSHHSVPTATMVNTAHYLAMLLVYVILKQMLLDIDYCHCL